MLEERGALEKDGHVGMELGAWLGEADGKVGRSASAPRGFSLCREISGST